MYDTGGKGIKLDYVSESRGIRYVDCLGVGAVGLAALSEATFPRPYGEVGADIRTSADLTNHQPVILQALPRDTYS